jgi:endo-1,4-beta-xylanase
MDALGGAGTTGYDWVITAFEMARAIFPEGTRLMLNDYGILGSTSGAQDYIELIELLQDRDLIDVIGVQGHAFSTRPGAPIGAVLDLLGETGLPVQVTEMDVDGNPNVNPSVTPEQSDQNQLQDMQRIFPAIYEHPAVEGITLWGWRPGLWRTDQEAYLVQSNGEHRPALTWLQDYLANFSVSVEPEVELSTLSVVNHPNPFFETTRIRYALSKPTDVTLKVFDVTGRLVATLVSSLQVAGEHEVLFDASGLASGVYLYRLSAGQQVQTGQMVRMR